MASRIEQEPPELLEVREDEVEEGRSGQSPDVALDGGDGGLAARDQVGDDSRIGLDQGWRAACRPRNGTLVRRDRRDEVAAIKEGFERIADERIASAHHLQEARTARLAPPAADVVRQEQTAARARALLARLPENYRTVLSHRLLEGLSVAETARCMGTSEANVKVLQHRALKRAAELREDDTVDG